MGMKNKKFDRYPHAAIRFSIFWTVLISTCKEQSFERQSVWSETIARGLNFTLKVASPKFSNFWKFELGVATFSLITQPPPKEGARSVLLHSCQSQT